MRRDHIKGRYPPRCPHCSGLLDLGCVKPRNFKSFACPTCHRFLEVVAPHTGLLVAASLLCSALSAWLAGLRGTLLVAVIFPLSLPIFIVESAVVGLLLDIRVRPYEGSGGVPKAHYLALGISGRENRRSECGSDASSPSSEDEGK